MTWKVEVASEVTSGRSSKRGATRGGAFAAARDDFLTISTLVGEALPLDSDLGLISTSSREGLTRDDGDAERLVLMWVAESDGESRALSETSSLMAVTEVELISCERLLVSTDTSRFMPFASMPLMEAGAEAPEFGCAMVKRR